MISTYHCSKTVITTLTVRTVRNHVVSEPDKLDNLICSVEWSSISLTISGCWCSRSRMRDFNPGTIVDARLQPENWLMILHTLLHEPQRKMHTMQRSASKGVACVVCSWRRVCADRHLFSSVLESWIHLLIRCYFSLSKVLVIYSFNSAYC